MEEVGKYIAELAKYILGFSSMGLPGWIAAAVFAIVVTLGGFFLSRWAKQYKLEEINKKTDQGRSDSSSNVSKEGRDIEKDASSAADEIDRIGRPN